MTMTNERRNFLKAVSGAAASTAVLAGTPALAQGNLQAAAKVMPYQAKPMPFDPKTITGISESNRRFAQHLITARLSIGVQILDADPPA